MDRRLVTGLVRSRYYLAPVERLRHEMLDRLALAAGVEVPLMRPDVEAGSLIDLMATGKLWNHRLSSDLIDERILLISCSSLPIMRRSAEINFRASPILSWIS